MAKYIDVHCHLNMDRFSEDLDEVINRAKDEEVLIIQGGVNPESNREALEISKKYGVLCSFGLYPIDSIANEFEGLKDDDYLREIPAFSVDEELSWIEEHQDDCVAIGEVGLDFKVVECTPEMKDAQVKVFRKSILLAKKLDKPTIIHSRGGEERVIEILEEEGYNRVVMHCFGGKKGLIKRGAANGWFFSVPAVISRLHHFENLVKIVPLNQLLTETDAPFLSPVKGERSEPVNVKGTITKIAEIKGLDEEEVRIQILDNAKRVFSL